MNATDLQTISRSISEEMNLSITVTAFDAHESEKLGRQIRVRVHCENQRQTWKLMRQLGCALNERIDGRVFVDRQSHRETRIGSVGGCRGWITGSAADLRVYPDARIAKEGQ